MPNQTRKYELMIAVRGSLLDSEAQTVLNELKTELTNNHANIFYEENWGKTPLAYKIKHEKEVFYFVLNFNYNVAKISDLETYLRLDQNIVRSLVSKIEQENYQPLTRKEYDEAREKYVLDKQSRQKQSMPKTRATTSAQLEEEMLKIKEFQAEKTTDEKVAEILSKDLSL